VADAVVDASVWVSRLVAAVAHHVRVIRWFDAREAEGGLFIAPSLMLPEVAGAISRRTGAARLARRATRALLALPSLRLVVLDAELSEQAAELASDLSLRGADAVYAAVALRLEVPLVTLDREQRERSAAAIEVASPT
jgi:predicted nucleic acid-binding protein